MASEQQRAILFWFFCIPIRSIIAAAITISSLKGIYELSIVFSIFAVYTGIGLLVKFCASAFSQIRRLPHSVDNPLIQFFILSNDTGNFGGPVWWQFPRLVHAILLLCYAAFALGRFKFAYIFSIVDVGMAIVFWMIYFCASLHVEHGST